MQKVVLILVDSINKIMPIRKFKFHKHKHKGSNYKTNGIIHLIKYRDKLYRVINEKKIEFVPKKGTFLVEGTRGDQYAVTLFPESCQCPATNQCYHILTARKSIGMDISSKIKKCNLTVMMKRSKTSGRKKPRINDYKYQFSAAPDSEVGVGLSNTPKSPKLDNSFFSISSNTEINSCNHEYAQASTPVQK